VLRLLAVALLAAPADRARIRAYALAAPVNVVVRDSSAEVFVEEPL
jgi:hypothetical protein